MKPQIISFVLAAMLAGAAPVAAEQPTPSAVGRNSGWGVLSDLAGRKFVWNSGRARRSDDSELTFHEFHWQGQVLAQTQCSYWPLRNLRAVCGTNLIEKQPDGSLLLRANGGKPHFKGTLAADGSVEFVNKTMFGSFVTAFNVQPNGSVSLAHRNRVDGESQAPLIPVDAAREAEIMADMESIYAAAQAQKREEAERRYDAFMGAMATMNTALSAGLEIARANEARSRAELDRTIVQSENMKRSYARQTGSDSAPAHAAAEVGATDGEGRAASIRTGGVMPSRSTDATTGPGAPLRFVLSIGLQPRSGDSVNPTCYSNVITRPGPPGWGQGGSLPPGSSASARATVQAFKSRFISACRAASGREVTSEGNFEWNWNESQDGNMRIASSRARFKEDVTVNID